MTNDASRQPSSTAPDWEAIARYLAGESTDGEAVRVRGWLEANPGGKAVIERLDTVITIEQPGVDVEAALRNVHARMAEPTVLPRLGLERGGANRARRSPWIIPALAAAAIVVVAVTVSRRSSSGPNVALAPAAHTYSTAVGQRDSVLLADGSRIILGPDSRLTVPGDYGTGSRTVELHGDGYFDVRHDAARPFAVHVANALVEDVGTTFTVESDPGDTTAVAVMAGMVRLRPAGSEPTAGALLAAGDRGSLTADGRVHAYPHGAHADDAAWTAGRLVFRDASLARVAGEIHRWYGIELRVTDSSLLNHHVTTTLNGESADQMLRILRLALGVRIDRQGDTAIVSPSRGGAIVR